MSANLETATAVDEPAGDQDQERPEKPVCENCRSADITFDATAYWDAKQQQFQYDIFRNKVFCLHCDGRQRVDWVPV